MDVTIQAQILELMQELAREIGTAMVIITHNLGVVARYASRVLVMYAGKIVESGSAKDIYHDPKHPYTLGLLGSVPRLDAVGREKLESIEGLPPDLIDLPPGCSFAPRCRFAYARCSQETPELQRVGDGHEAACWRSSELTELARAGV